MVIINICVNGHRTDYPDLNGSVRVERQNKEGLPFWKCPSCGGGFRQALAINPKEYK